MEGAGERGEAFYISTNLTGIKGEAQELKDLVTKRKIVTFLLPEILETRG